MSSTTAFWVSSRRVVGGGVCALLGDFVVDLGGMMGMKGVLLLKGGLGIQ